MAETILIVDDEAANRDLLEAILTEQGYRVEQADSGSAALAKAAEALPDLILLDLMMPGLSGIEVCRLLRADPATAGVPILVITALGHVSTKEVALTSGADDFVTKPVQPEDITTRVSALLKVRRIRQDLDRTLAYLHELDAGRHAARRRGLVKVLGEGGPSPAAGPFFVPILLVDDELLTRQFYGDLLGENGFRVLAAGSGAEGLELLRHSPVEAVIADIMMPAMSGLQFLERVRGLDPDLPVIMLTAHANSRNAIAALKLGAFDFIVKGLDRDLVVLAVHRAVRHRQEILNKHKETEGLLARISELEDRSPTP